MAASAASGISFSHAGASITQPSSSKPCQMVLSLVFTPALIFTELRAITLVIGSPPMRPAKTLPTPCARSSRLAGVVRCSGSILSTASMFSSVSSEATIAMVNAVPYTAGLFHALKSG